MQLRLSNTPLERHIYTLMFKQQHYQQKQQKDIGDWRWILTEINSYNKRHKTEGLFHCLPFFGGLGSTLPRRAIALILTLSRLSFDVARW